MAAVGVDPGRGLAEAEAEARLARHGPNELPAEKPPSAWTRFLAQLRGPLNLLLVVATAVSLLVWTIERESPLPYEALTILAVLLLNAALGFVQEGRAEQALQELRRLSAAQARSDEASAFRGLRANRWLWLAVVASTLLQLVVVYVPAFQKAFSTVPLGAWDWALCLSAASAVLWSSEIAKLVRGRASA